MASEQKELEDALLATAWEVDCFAITLTRNHAMNPESIVGKGFLRQEKDGIVHFRLYPS
jgi:hypothetical protein